MHVLADVPMLIVQARAVHHVAAKMPTLRSRTVWNALSACSALLC